MTDEGSLIRDALAGSDAAYCELVRAHQRRIRTYLGRHVRDQEQADDLAQEVFITAYQTLSAFRGDAPLGSWLLGIARVMALRHLQEEARRNARQPLLALLAARRLERTERDAGDDGRHERELSALGECIKGLPQESGHLVRERYFNRSSAAAIADGLGRKESAVRMILLRLRQALRRCVEQRLAARGAQA